jgi:holo-[acyl-carrier protein] synthase
VDVSRCNNNHLRPFYGGEDPAPGGAILGLGTDLCAVARMAQALAGEGPDVLGGLFTPAELARCRAGGDAAGRLAACFAAKEAVVKALAAAGGQGSYWQDIEVREEGGRPQIALRGRLAELSAALGVRRILVAQGRCRRYAAATALATT